MFATIVDRFRSDDRDCICVAGCDSSSSKSSGGASMDQMAGAVDAQKSAKKQEADSRSGKSGGGPKSGRERPRPTPAASRADEESRRSADAGTRRRLLRRNHRCAAACDERGRQHRLDPRCAKLQGEEGRKPKDNDEFMKVVVTEIRTPVAAHRRRTKSISTIRTAKPTAISASSTLSKRAQCQLHLPGCCACSGREIAGAA